MISILQLDYIPKIQFMYVDWPINKHKRMHIISMHIMSVYMHARQIENHML